MTDPHPDPMVQRGRERLARQNQPEYAVARIPAGTGRRGCPRCGGRIMCWCDADEIVKG